MSPLVHPGPILFILFILVLGGRLIWLRRTERWKRVGSFPVAMVLLSLAIILVSLGKVLSNFGR